MAGGVADEPTITSALDSVTKRRALVVALVGSPASSSTMVLIFTPPISVGTKSSAFFSGTPSAATGPVVLMVIPTVNSCAATGVISPGSAAEATNATAAIIDRFI